MKAFFVIALLLLGCGPSTKPELAAEVPSDVTPRERALMQRIREFQDALNKEEERTVQIMKGKRIQPAPYRLSAEMALDAVAAAKQHAASGAVDPICYAPTMAMLTMLENEIKANMQLERDGARCNDCG